MSQPKEKGGVSSSLDFYRDHVNSRALEEVGLRNGVSYIHGRKAVSDQQPHIRSVTSVSSVQVEALLSCYTEGLCKITFRTFTNCVKNWLRGGQKKS